jgi:uncharacterized damage-inducible protein DinB
MYQSTQSFIEDYRNESQGTQKLLNALTDESLKQAIAPGYRTLGHIAWHLVPFGGILTAAGLEYASPTEDREPPESAAVIAQAFQAAGEALLDAVSTQWTDEKLQEPLNLFGQKWTYGLVLDVFIKHEVHHRGQLTILMRQAGLPVTGVYGPSKEEWAYAGMQAPKF